MILKYVVKIDDKYSNINQILKNEFNFSSRLMFKVIKNKRVFLNNKFVDTRTQISTNDCITVYLDFEEDNSNIIPTKMNLQIIYEDEAFLIINKPAGIATHPSQLHYNNSLSNGIKFYFDSIGCNKKVRPVNRLDKNTSGLVIFAKNEYIQECLIKQMQNKIFIKEYIAIVEGIVELRSGTINAPIARKENSIIERCVCSNGDIAITHYNVLKSLKNTSVVHVTLETGRTHQIRVHLSNIGHPILGDTLYGNPSSVINRQALHAYKVKFIHPITGLNVEYIATIPSDIKSIIK